jgi:hypothetical protein
MALRTARASKSNSRLARPSQRRSGFLSQTQAGDDDTEHPQTGLRALINGQSHARRDTQFFKGKAVDKEHIGGSMLVTLDCSELGQTSRNDLFMSNREMFREDPLPQRRDPAAPPVSTSTRSVLRERVAE